MDIFDDLVSRWLSLPEVAEALGVELRAVREMLTERRFVAVHRGPDSVLSVPADFLVLEGETSPIDGAPVVIPALLGTIIQLGDNGFEDPEMVRWLFSENDELGAVPIAALRAGRTHAVRRAAQSLSF